MEQAIELLKAKEKELDKWLLNIRFFSDESCGVYDDLDLIKAFNSIQKLNEWLNE